MRWTAISATTTIRGKRASVVSGLPDWEQLRAAGAAIKDDVLARLDTYLLQLEAAVQQRRAPSTGPATPPRRTRSSPAWVRAAGSRRRARQLSAALTSAATSRTKSGNG